MPSTATIQQDVGDGTRRRVAGAEPYDEHAHTMAIAGKAVERIKALRLPATPRNFEIWYAYATGHYPSLTHAVDDLLARQVKFGDGTLERIGEQFISQGGIKDRIDTVGIRVAGAIVQIIAALDKSIFAAVAHTDNLAQAGDTAADAVRDREAARTVIERLAQAAKAIKGDRRRLEAQLNASGDEIRQLRQELKLIRSDSLTDPITGLANRTSFEQSIRHAMTEAAERGEPLALVMADIDHFKVLNDTWGHQTGDQVLRLVANEVKRNVPGNASVARYGGEEFAVVLVNTPLPTACEVADRVRRSIMSRGIMSRSTGEHLGRVTISFGVAAAHDDDTLDTLVERADACLYAAKCSGRNRVISELDPEYSGEPATAAVA